MAVSTVDAGVVRLGDNVTTEFSFNFKVSRAEDVRVANLVEQSIVPLDPGEYSVMLNPGNVGGEVTLASAPLLGDRIYIYRETNLEQLVEVSSQTKYDPVVVEGVWDKLTLIAQELNAKAERAVKTVPGENPDLLIDAISASVVSAQGAASQAAASESAAAASAAAADADAAQASADRVQTSLDAAATAADRIQTGLDRVQTGLDKAATAADRVQTDLDAAATAADRVQTGLDKTATSADRIATAADAQATAADRVQTGLDRDAAAASADAAAISAASLVKAAQGQAEAGTDDTAYMTPLKTAQQRAANLASQAEAEAGADNTKLMTPLRTKEAAVAFRNQNAFGWGQTWQDMTASRLLNTRYQNTTGRPISVECYTTSSTTHALSAEVSVDGVTWVALNARPSGSYSVGSSMFRGFVPNGHYYRIVVTGTNPTFSWKEIR